MSFKKCNFYPNNFKFCAVKKNLYSGFVDLEKVLVVMCNRPLITIASDFAILLQNPIWFLILKMFALLKR